MKIITIIVGPVQTNTYICYNKTTRRGFIVDPGAEADKLLARISAEGLDICAILFTHGHFDHICAVNEVKAALGAKVYASKKEAALANDKTANGMKSFGVPAISTDVDEFLSEGDVVDFGCGEIQVLSTPGHTHGHLCFYLPHENVIFTGDTLFHESYGRYDFPTGDFATLKQSLTRLFELPAQTRVYPGHDQPTTIGHEAVHNPIVRGL